LFVHRYLVGLQGNSQKATLFRFLWDASGYNKKKFHVANYELSLEGIDLCVKQWFGHLILKVSVSEGPDFIAALEEWNMKDKREQDWMSNFYPDTDNPPKVIMSFKSDSLVTKKTIPFPENTSTLTTTLMLPLNGATREFTRTGSITSALQYYEESTDGSAKYITYHYSKTTFTFSCCDGKLTTPLVYWEVIK
jgi:hypothetical protein